VYLLGRALGDGTDALELLESLRRTGRGAPVVLVGERPDFATMRRAVELEVSDFLLAPLETGELARALARAAAERPARPRIDAAPRAHALERRYANDAHTVGRAAREISAFLTNEGVASAHRVRIASALAELVDNAARHGYGGGAGEIAIRVEVQRTRVVLSVEDEGRGFDPERTKLERVPAALPGHGRARRLAAVPGSGKGLGRVERLCEAHSIASSERGTRVELVFELTPVRFDDESEHLAETDFLDPERARSLIAALRRGQEDLSSVAPSMALTVGRLIAGLDGRDGARARSTRS
jgi:anti-sigma regulatory factor (Ser/Thr protein kinase)